MIKHARGLVCLAMTKARCERHGLQLMSEANGSRHETAFTISIEAREGVTTGISAPTAPARWPSRSIRRWGATIL